VKSDCIIAIPAASRGWEIWKWTRRKARLLKTVDMLDELPSGGSDAVIGLSPEDCVSVAMQLPTADHTLFGDMAFAQVEMKGLAPGGPENTVLAYHVLEREPGRSFLSVDVLTHDFNEDLCVKKAQAYTAAARMFPIHDHAVVVFRQHDRLVLAAGKHGRMAFSQILNCGTEFNQAFFQEVNLTILSLQGAGQLPERVTLEIWTDVLPEDRDNLERKFTMAVDFTRRPDPDPRLAKDASSPLLPIPIQTALAKSRRAQKIRFAVLLGILVYSAIAVFVAMTTIALKEKTDRLERQVSTRKSRVLMIKTEQARAEIFVPAYDKKLYPMIQLDEITRIMPDQGIVIREFRSKDREIRIEGIASGPEIVVGFVESLNADADLPSYSWEQPQAANVKENKTATFVIVGKYASAN
jgi:hypothetical protein